MRKASTELGRWSVLCGFHDPQAVRANLFDDPQSRLLLGPLLTGFKAVKRASTVEEARGILDAVSAFITDHIPEE